jgi:hypothetical protein
MSIFYLFQNNYHFLFHKNKKVIHQGDLKILPVAYGIDGAPQVPVARITWCATGKFKNLKKK